MLCGRLIFHAGYIFFLCLLGVSFLSNTHGQRKDRNSKENGGKCPVSEESEEALFAAAVSAWQAGKLGVSGQCTAHCLRLFPSSAQCWYRQGLVRQRQDLFVEAVKVFSTAVELSPTSSLYYHQLGGSHLLQGPGMGEHAKSALLKAESLAPASASVLADLALAKYYTGDVDGALQGWRRCGRLDAANEAQYLYNVVGVYQERSQFAEAHKVLRRMLKLDPVSSEVYEGLGVVQSSMLRYSAALASFNTSIRLFSRRQDTSHKHLARLHSLVGDAALNLERFADAIPSYTAALSHRETLSVGASLLYASLKTCEWSRYTALTEQVVRGWKEIQKRGEGDGEVHVEPYAASMFDLDAATLRDMAARRSNVMEAQLRGLSISPVHPRALTNSKLHIGFLSADLQRHSVGTLLQASLALFNRDRFRVVCFSLRKDDSSEERRRIVAGSDNFLDISEKSHQECAEKINSEQVHVLIDMMGHTRFNQIQVLVLRPAPVQVHYMGSTQSVASLHIPWFLTDRVASPPETAPLYAERLVYLPAHFFVASHKLVTPHPHNNRPSSPSPSPSSSSPPPPLSPRSSGRALLCALNDPAKLSPDVFSDWLHLLSKTASSASLWLSVPSACAARLSSLAANSSSLHHLRSDSWRANTALAAAHDSALSDVAARLVLERFASGAEFERAFGRCDLFLDTRIYSAQNTALQGLWLGVLMVTVAGELQKNRALASMLLHFPFPHTLARSREEYLEIARRLAASPRLLGGMRTALQDRRRDSALFDTERWVRGAEKALVLLWEDHVHTRAGKTRQGKHVIVARDREAA